MLSITTQIILWLVAALVAAPVIRKLGLDRPRGADDHLSHDERETAWRNRLREVFEFLALIGGSLGVLYLMHRSLAAGAPPSARGAIFLLSILLWTFGFLIAIVVLGLIGHFLFRGAARTPYHIALSFLFLFGFVMPLHHDNARDREVVEERTSVAAQYLDLHKRLRLQWRQDLEAAGAHGGEGVVPPMLQVLDSGEGVQVTNIGDEPLCLDLRRSNARLGPGHEYQCALWSERSGLHSCVEYAPARTRGPWRSIWSCTTSTAGSRLPVRPHSIAWKPSPKTG